jgi:SH3-like domain-containing protein
MNRLLLSLWLLGAALYGANTLLYTNVIFGWSGPKQKIDTSGVDNNAVKPKAAAETGDQDRDRSPAEVAESQSQEPNAQPPAEPQGQSQSGGQQQQQVQSAPPAAQPAPADGAVTPPSQPEQAQNESKAQPQQQTENLQASQPQQQAESAQAPQTQTAGEWVGVAPGGANVRSAPYASASQLATLPPGMSLRVISRQGDWVQIASSDGSQTGWVYERLLEPSGAPSAQAPVTANSPQAPGPEQQQSQDELVKVSGSTATMRSGPSEEAAALFAFPNGRVFRLVSRKPGWVEVMDMSSKQTGWIEEASIEPAHSPSAQQQAASAPPPPQRANRNAGPGGYDTADGPPPRQARGGWVPYEEDLGPPDAANEPEDLPRRWGHRHHGGLAGILRRALGGL